MSKLFIEAAAGTYRGRKRAANEDTAFWFVPADHHSPAAETLLVIGAAGGMGGAGAGDEASGAARGFIESVFMEGGEAEFVRAHGLSPDGDYTAFLNEVFTECNRRVVSAASDAHKEGLMGTTLVLGVIVYNLQDEKTYLHVGNVGNCRGYIIRGEQIFHATEEDSVAWRLYKKGSITYSELLAHPLRSQITVMGIDASISPEVHSIELQPGDIVLFCTDGVHEAVSDAEIGRVTGKYTSARKACAHLIEAARMARGGTDNAAAAMALCSAVPVAAPRRMPGNGTASRGSRATESHHGMLAAAAQASPVRRRWVTTAVWSLVGVLALTALAVYLSQSPALQTLRGYFGRQVDMVPAVSGPVGARKDSLGTHAEQTRTTTAAGKQNPALLAKRQAQARDDARAAAAARQKEAAQKEAARKERMQKENARAAAAVAPQQKEAAGAPAERSAAVGDEAGTSRATAAAPVVSVEWNAETERFRITTTGPSTVPVKLRYGSMVFDVVPVKSVPNLYRTVKPLTSSMISRSRTVHVTMAQPGYPVVVTFTETK